MMKTKRAIVVVALLATAGGVGVGHFAARARGEIDARREKRLGENAALREALQKEMERSFKSASVATKPASAPVEKLAAKAEGAFPPRSRPPGLSDFAKERPQVWNEFINSKRAEFSRYYLPLFQRMQLSAQQRAAFVTIHCDWLAGSTDIAAAAKEQGLEHEDPAIKTLREEAQNRMKAQLQALFGETGYREYEVFERAMPARGYVDGLAVQLAATAPISAQQADQLERALAETNPAFARGGRVDLGAMDWVEADRRAKAILTPEQFAVWQRGVAHNTFGGSRRAQELEAVYRRAVERAKAAAKAQEN